MGLYQIGIILGSLWLVPNIWDKEPARREADKARRMFAVLLPSMATAVLVVWGCEIFEYDYGNITLAFAASVLMVISSVVAILLDFVCFKRSANAPVFSAVSARAKINGALGHFLLGMFLCALSALIVLGFHFVDTHALSLRGTSLFWRLILGTDQYAFAFVCGGGAMFFSLGVSGIASLIQFAKV